MADKKFLLVCEGETDIYVFKTLAEHFSSITDISHRITSLAPQQDATSGTYPAFGYGSVINWCIANRSKLSLLMDFHGANGLFVQMDTDIAAKINPSYVTSGLSARACCEQRLNQALDAIHEPENCHYILPTQNTETWLLASQNFSVLDQNMQEVHDFEKIEDPEQLLILLGFKSKKQSRTRRRLDKTPATQYKKYGKELTCNLMQARQRCSELERLCGLMT